MRNQIPVLKSYKLYVVNNVDISIFVRSEWRRN